MNLFEKSQAVRKLFQKLEEESRQFHAESGMGCISGCGFCCVNPDVPASPLEFLPLAFDLYEKGIAEEIANQLALQDQLGNCVVYRPQKDDPTKGFCGNYANRGLICRLFGASARRTKYGQKELITCKILKKKKRRRHLSLLFRGSIQIWKSPWLHPITLSWQMWTNIWPVSTRSIRQF